ncbi:periplasmic heavy metal sensor [Brevundimonas sp. GCM10030266]|uniref:periplasmic heavy metal sensor n=1 Tax=Brevundimonas sp. GCM10030266 TaxID=3273386 RepID=UPI00360984C8
MSPKALKIVLAASVAFNLFAVAAGGTIWVTHKRAEQRIEAQQRPAREHSTMSVIARLSPEVRRDVRQALKASALAAKPDFEEARAKRREAIDLSASNGFDAARVRTLLDQSRAAELRGRARLEAEAVTLLATLSPDDRAVLSEILSRRGRGARDRNDGPQAERK